MDNEDSTIWLLFLDMLKSEHMDAIMHNFPHRAFSKVAQLEMSFLDVQEICMVNVLDWPIILM